ncbi:tyrosine-protein phosphatase [Brevundimonas sp. NPDC003935]|uniref:tyrosine-protein phosphatase n=1 Tax=unclassified Brevundimonas TaxID=2622653 RepID=UPI002899B39E|nr:tyrosine-protein phosphatase [Brevundimonas sp.]
MSDRLSPFQAIDNFRDYGGYAVGDGRIASGRLYRSAHQARATEADLARLAELNLAVVVDLRRPSERREQPSRRPADWAGRVIESVHDDGGEAPHITFLKSADLTEASGRAFMTDTYRRLPFEAAHVDLFARYFRALAEVGGPVLIHCAAGKDRTGLLAALTHSLLGVSRDDLISDYLLTNVAVDLEGRAEGIARKLTEMTGRPASHGAVVAFLGVEADYLDGAFAEITARHGSIEGYLEQALGVDAALAERIRARLTA